MPEPIALFVPCYVDQLRPRAGAAAVELLEALGHEVRVRPEAVCCGQPFSNCGMAAEGSALARRWYEAMAGERAAVVLSSSCTVQLRHRPPAPGAPTGAAAAAPGAGPAAPAPATEVLELCEFLNRRHPQARFGRLERKVALHSSCHGLRDSDADSHARAVLARVEGLNLLRPRRAEECCGFGGTFSVTFSDLSLAMGEERLADLLLTGAREVVATDLSCLLHLEGIARSRGEPVVFRHVAELLREAVAP
jgi:L-lactate dehydrogenase complex protein LldE